MGRLASLIASCSLLLTARSARADEPPVPEPAPAPAATEPPPPTIDLAAGRVMSEQLTIGDGRSVAEEFLVLPEGLDLGGTVRAVTADGGLGATKLKLTDVALFDAHVQWAFHPHYELDLSASVLAKQPSSTREDIFQGGALTVRRDVAHQTAIALGGGVSPLLDLGGEAIGGQLFLTHKHRLNEIVTFSLAGGADTTIVRAAHAMDTPYLVEAAAHAAVLVRVPNGVWGGWLGVGYALPAVHRGHDPVSGMALDPQPRLDIDIGNAVQLDENWDLTADLVVLDRGDLANPATRLPVLDGGFDQIQITVGVSRRFHPGHERHRGISEPLIQLE